MLIARYRLNPFIVITLVSIGLALTAGMPADTIMGSYEAGVGKTLGHIALVVALGTMLGKMMAESGGAEQVARTLINRFGERNAHWAMVSLNLAPEELKQLELMRNRFLQLTNSLNSLMRDVFSINPLPSG